MSEGLRYVTLVIFALTWVLIAARRLRFLPIGRPAGALLGAVAMVAAGSLTPEEAYAALDHNTLLLLFGTMLCSVYAERTGLLERAGALCMGIARTPRSLLFLVNCSAGLASALFVNDTVCVFFTPLVVLLCQRAGLPMGPYLIALATGANLGSAATLVGNPQNMVVGSLSGIGFARFSLLLGPAALVALCANGALLCWVYGRRLGERPLPAVAWPPPSRATGRVDGRAVGVVLLGLWIALVLGAHMAFATLGAAVVLMLWDRRDPGEVFARVDWPLLAFFAALFVVVAGVEKTGDLERALGALKSQIYLGDGASIARFCGFSLIGSNLFSNVPFVLLVGQSAPELGPAELVWTLLAFTATAAGNATLLGSVANLIVAERARPAHDLSFLEYLRFGLPATLLVTALSTPVLVLTVRLLA